MTNIFKKIQLKMNNLLNFLKEFKIIINIVKYSQKNVTKNKKVFIVNNAQLKDIKIKISIHLIMLNNNKLPIHK